MQKRVSVKAGIRHENLNEERQNIKNLIGEIIHVPSKAMS